jgi:hypothetical protein
MKKLKFYLVPFLAIIVVAIAFTSCEKDDAGYYSPDKKIYKIFVEELGQPKLLEQEWVWNGKLLDTIKYFDMNVYDGFESFIYENKRLVKVIDSYNYYSNYTYNDKYYSKIEYFHSNGTLLADLTFTYLNDKVSNMVYTTYVSTKHVYTMLQRGVLGKMMPDQVMQEFVKKAVSQENMSKGIINIAITYDGDNISTYTMGEYTINLSGYDTKMNPMYKFFPFETYNEDPAPMVFSKNNPGTMNSVLGSFTIPTTYLYTYVGDYPTEIVQTTSLGSVSVSTKIYIEYN